jgi:predicted dehydrogenase
LPPCSYPESFDRSVAGFAEAILNGRPAPVTGGDGLAVLRLDAAMVEAMQTGRAVPFGGNR